MPSVGLLARLRPRRWVIIFLAALLFAVGVSGWQGWLHWRLGNPQVDQTATVGELVTIDGSNYRVEAFTIAEEFPNSQQGEPPVQAPEGSKIVLVVLITEIIDASIDPETHYCFGELVDDAGRTWRTESSITWSIERPEAVGCTGTSERPIKPHRPRRVGFSYLVPAEAADRVALKLRLPPKDDHLLLVEQ